MRKMIALLLAVIMCLSLVGCGGNKVDVSEAVIGDRIGVSEYQGVKVSASSDNKLCVEAGHNVTTTLSIFKGGTMQFTVHGNETGYEFTTDGTWEVSDDVLVITYTFSMISGEKATGWEVDTDTTPYTLNVQGTDRFFPKTLSKNIVE